MKADEITIDIKANLMVDKETAEACLKLVELYVNQTGIDIIGHKSENGEISYEFAPDCEG